MKCPMCGDELVAETLKSLGGYGITVIRCPICHEPIDISREAEG